MPKPAKPPKPPKPAKPRKPPKPTKKGFLSSLSPEEAQRAKEVATAEKIEAAGRKAARKAEYNPSPRISPFDEMVNEAVLLLKQAMQVPT